MFSTKKVGGLRFVKIGRLSLSGCICKPKTEAQHTRIWSTPIAAILAAGIVLAPAVTVERTAPASQQRWFQIERTQEERFETFLNSGHCEDLGLDDDLMTAQHPVKKFVMKALSACYARMATRV